VLPGIARGRRPAGLHHDDRSGRRWPGHLGLIEHFARRLPQWAGRIWTGNAVDWRSPAGLRFDYVHILLDSVPWARRVDLVRHHLAHTVRLGIGRLLVSDYAADPAVGHPAAAETLSSLGFHCAGQTSGGTRPGRPPNPTAWIPASPGSSGQRGAG